MRIVTLLVPAVFLFEIASAQFKPSERDCYDVLNTTLQYSKAQNLDVKLIDHSNFLLDIRQYGRIVGLYRRPSHTGVEIDSVYDTLIAVSPAERRNFERQFKNPAVKKWKNPESFAEVKQIDSIAVLWEIARGSEYKLSNEFKRLYNWSHILYSAGLPVFDEAGETAYVRLDVQWMKITEDGYVMTEGGGKIFVLKKHLNKWAIFRIVEVWIS
jgi:hypothetical protein